jgi:hypothetical protein
MYFGTDVTDIITSTQYTVVGFGVVFGGMLTIMIQIIVVILSMFYKLLLVLLNI